MKGLLVLVGALIGFGVGFLTRPTVLGMQIPLEILTSDAPGDQHFRLQLFIHLVIAAAIGAALFWVVGIFLPKEKTDVRESSKVFFEHDVSTPQVRSFSGTDTGAMLANPRFQALVRARSTLGWSLTGVMIVIYFGFILLVAFNKDDGHILSMKVGAGPTTIAIVAGLAILVFVFLLNGLYVLIANAKFDRMSRELREEVGQ